MESIEKSALRLDVSYFDGRLARAYPAALEKDGNIPSR